MSAGLRLVLVRIRESDDDTSYEYEYEYEYEYSMTSPPPAAAAGGPGSVTPVVSASQAPSAPSTASSACCCCSEYSSHTCWAYPPGHIINIPNLMIDEPPACSLDMMMWQSDDIPYSIMMLELRRMMMYIAASRSLQGDDGTDARSPIISNKTQSLAGY